MENIRLNDYGKIPVYTLHENEMLARVTAVHRERYELVCDLGFCFGRLKKGRYFEGQEKYPTVGDYVVLDHNPAGDSRILHTLERKNLFARLDPSSSGLYDQAVAANFDYVFILQSLNQDFNINRLERYLTLARQSGADPVVVLTKADLKPGHEAEMAAAKRAAGNVPVLAVSAVTGQGMEGLSSYLKPRNTIVFLGSSGVGKSSLVNALMGETVMETGAVREADDRGRHTTTHRQLFRAPDGALFIDTPGMRVLGMWDAAEGLSETFSDVEALLGQCRFGDCRHENEPGCRIRQALESGELDPKRWKNYCVLRREAGHRGAGRKRGLRSGKR